MLVDGTKLLIHCCNSTYCLLSLVPTLSDLDCLVVLVIITAQVKPHVIDSREREALTHKLRFSWIILCSPMKKMRRGT